MTLKAQVIKFCYEHLTVVREEGSELAALCPFHENTDSPALYINKETGLWHCFNASCAKKGRFATLVKNITGEEITGQDVDPKVLDSMMKEFDKVFVEVNDGFEEAMDRITINYRAQAEVSKLQYLIDRGFAVGILEHFEVGYSVAQERIVIPVRDENYKVVGFIGRATDEKRKPKYKYTKGFDRRHIILNLQNAKFYDEVIVVEGSLDHLKVHQAGFPNVVSTMGSTLSPGQLDLLNKHFSSIIIFSDNDVAGDTMKHAIMDTCSQKELWIVIYPPDKKDPGEMTEAQIQNAISARITHLEYLFEKL